MGLFSNPYLAMSVIAYLLIFGTFILAVSAVKERMKIFFMK